MVDDEIIWDAECNWPSSTDLYEIADRAGREGRPRSVLVTLTGGADIFDGEALSRAALDVVLQARDVVSRHPNLHVLLTTRMPANTGAVLPGWCMRRWPASLWIGLAPGVGSADTQADMERAMHAFLALPAPHKFLLLAPVRGRVSLEIRWCATCGETERTLRSRDLVTESGDCKSCTEPLWDHGWCLSRLDWIIVGGAHEGADGATTDVTQIEEIIARADDEHVPVYVRTIGDRPTAPPYGLHVRYVVPDDYTTWPAWVRRRERPADLPLAASPNLSRQKA